MIQINSKTLEFILTAFIGIIVAYITSYLTTKRELSKVPYEIQKEYAKNLQQKRIELYPKYSILLSELVKTRALKEVSKEYIKNWMSAFHKADSEVTLYTSGRASNFIWDLLVHLYSLLDKYYDKSSETSAKEFSEKIDGLKLEKVENALKNDIGIYIVEFDPIIGRREINFDDINNLESDKYNKQKKMS